MKKDSWQRSEEVAEHADIKAVISDFWLNFGLWLPCFISIYSVIYASFSLHLVCSTLISSSLKYESHSVMSDSLWPHELDGPWNSPDQNTRVGSLSLLQGIFPTKVSHIAGGFFTSWATRETQEYWSG